MFFLYFSSIFSRVFLVSLYFIISRLFNGHVFSFNAYFSKPISRKKDSKQYTVSVIKHSFYTYDISCQIFCSLTFKFLCSVLKHFNKAYTKHIQLTAFYVFSFLDLSYGFILLHYTEWKYQTKSRT